MRVHEIIDYSFLYYKYKFALDKGKMRRMTVIDDSTGVNCERDISQIYYSLREIEGFRRKLDDGSNDVVVTICFDMPSIRNEELKKEDSSANIGCGYKSNRTKKLTDKDFKDIQEVEKILKLAGYNTFRIEGYEADDLITSLVDKYKNDFDYTIIYTPDKDLMVNICDNVGVYRYKWTTGYCGVNDKNYESYLEEEFKTKIPYNSLGLYLSTVGDKSDTIKGINKFGNAAWVKLVDWLNSNGIDWSKCGDFNELEKVLVKTSEYLKQDQFDQASLAFSLVRPMINDDISIDVNSGGRSTAESREKAYMNWNMKSLIN